MNSWSSIPNEYVVWLWIVRELVAPIADVLVHRALALLLRQRVPRPHLHERVDDEVRRALRHDLPRLPRARVLRGLRRREVRVRRLEPAGERRAVQRRAELAEVLVALGDLPEEEVAVRPHARDRVRAERGHAPGPVLDDLGERVLAGDALLDGQPPPGRIDPEERVGDVLAAHTGILEPRSRLTARWTVLGSRVLLVSVGDVRLFVDVDGAKLVPDGMTMRERPTIVLLHGGPGFDHSAFKAVYGSLAEIAQVVYYDHRGNGRSEHGPQESWTLDQWADDLRTLCDVLGIERPIVFGASFGGFVGLNYALRHPDHPARLILSARRLDSDGPCPRYVRAPGRGRGSRRRRNVSGPTRRRRTRTSSARVPTALHPATAAAGDPRPRYPQSCRHRALPVGAESDRLRFSRGAGGLRFL